MERETGYEGEKNPTFTSSNVVGTIGWYEEDPGVLGVPETPEKGNKATFVPTGSTADTYSVQNRYRQSRRL